MKLLYVAFHSFCFFGQLSVIAWDLITGTFWPLSIPLALICGIFWTACVWEAVRLAKKGKQA